MTAADAIARDAIKAWALTQVKPLTVLVLIVALPLVGYCHGRSVEARARAYGATKDSVKAADVVRAAAIETVTVYVAAAAESKTKSDKADQAVVIVNDSTLNVRATPTSAPVPVIVPRQVTIDLTALRRTVNDQAAAIIRLRSLVDADSAAIRARDHLLALEKPRRHWGLGGALGGSCNTHGCGPGGTIGLTYSLF